MLEGIDDQTGHKSKQSRSDSPYSRSALPTDIGDEGKGKGRRGRDHDIDHRGVNGSHDARAMAKVPADQHGNDKISRRCSKADQEGPQKKG